jgi:hypothetical protein
MGVLSSKAKPTLRRDTENEKQLDMRAHEQNKRERIRLQKRYGATPGIEPGPLRP